jgi:hypothetical protein
MSVKAGQPQGENASVSVEPGGVLCRPAGSQVATMITIVTSQEGADTDTIGCLA